MGVGLDEKEKIMGSRGLDCRGRLEGALRAGRDPMGALHRLSRRGEGAWPPERTRAHRQGRTAPCLSVHPTYGTVGSALRRVQERMAIGIHSGLRVVVLLPVDETAAWNKLLKHGRVVGRWEGGEHDLEHRVLGTWRPTPFRRPMQLVLFPRAAGSLPRRSGYTLSPDGAGMVLPLLRGSYVCRLPQTLRRLNRRAGCRHLVPSHGGGGQQRGRGRDRAHAGGGEGARSGG